MLVFFNFVPTDEVIDWLKNKLNIQTEEGQYDVFKHGTIIIWGIFTLIFMLILLALQKCKFITSRDDRIYKFYKRVKYGVFYNAIIRYFYTGAITL